MIQGPVTIVKFLRVELLETFQDIPSKVKDKLLYLAYPPRKKETELLLGLLCFLEKTYFIYE